jgi:hypothetical protein
LKPKQFLFRPTLALAVAALWTAALPAAQSDTDLGSQAAPFLTWPADARTAAMGQAGVASAYDVNADDLNPAGLAQVSGEQFSLNEALLFQGTSLENAAAAVGVFQGAALGLDVTYLNTGTVDASTYNPATGSIVSAGSFNPYYYSVGLTYAEDLFSTLNLGASVKTIGEDIDNSTASTVAFDLGAEYDLADLTTLQGLSLGSSLQNFGPQLAGADLPTTWRTGVSYKFPFFDLRDTLLLNGDFQVPVLATWGQTTFSVGAELRYGRFLSLRVGYQTGDYGGVTGLTGITAGAGFGMDWWQVDYAWVPEGDLGLADQFSFSAKF